MKVLIVSDGLPQAPGEENVTQVRWDETPPSYLGTYHAVIIDFTVSADRKVEEIQHNLQVLEKALVPSNIDQDNMIVAAVCGSKNKEYWERPRAGTSEDESAPLQPEHRFVYDYLSEIVPDYDRRVQFIEEERGFEPLSIKYISIRQYLDLVKGYFLIFRYTPDSEVCANIFPLAKTKRTSNACIAFEHRVGKGVVIVLPGYQADRAAEAKRALIKVCGNYFKIREDCDELELQLAELAIPQEIRDSYTESLLCYLNDLYSSSCVSSGKALETTLHLLGIKGDTFHKKILSLEKLDILYPKTVQLMKNVKVLRNAAAHANLPTALLTDEVGSIDEEDARSMLLLLKHVLSDVLPIDKTAALIKEGSR